MGLEWLFTRIDCRIDLVDATPCYRPTAYRYNRLSQSGNSRLSIQKTRSVSRGRFGSIRNQTSITIARSCACVRAGVCVCVCVCQGVPYIGKPAKSPNARSYRCTHPRDVYTFLFGPINFIKAINNLLSCRRFYVNFAVTLISPLITCLMSAVMS